MRATIGELMSDKIQKKSDGSLVVPEHVTLPFIEGDGVGPDIWNASQKVFDAAVKKAYGDKRKVRWLEILAGEKAHKQTGEWLPDATIDAIREYSIAIKGPLTTPVGGGIRSLNVTLRQVLDLYACIRPVRYYPGVPSPMRTPEKVNMIIFRENTEDVYAGIEAAAGSKEAKELAESIERILGKKVREGSAIGIKPISEFGSKRLIKAAIEYAIQMKLPSVTLMHKGNIMKFTEGAFASWGYDIAKAEFGNVTVPEAELAAQNAGSKVVIKDRIADSLFQQIQMRPEEYSVIAATNLNGDYISDALAALVGGLGIAPGGNVGTEGAVFEATHGTAPKYAGMDKVNPGSLILSGKMMFDYLGWREVGELIDKALERTIGEGIVTYDLARGMQKAKEVSCSKFGESIVERL